MPVALNDVLRVSCRQDYGAVAEVVNVFHFKVTSVASGAVTDFNDDIAGYVSNAFANVAAILTSGLSPNVLDTYNVTQDFPMGQTNWTGAYTGGGGGGDPLPSGVAGLILWNTLEKRVQGKTYLGPFVEGALTGGAWTSSYVTAVTNFANFLLAGFAGDGGELAMGVYSRHQGTWFVPSGYRTPTVPAYQRRRRAGHGS